MTWNIDKAELRRQFSGELTRNILPFWMTRVVDKTGGGLYGAVSNDLQVDNEVPRSAVLCSRVLWTYSAAYRHFGDPEYLAMAEWVYDNLTRVFWDAEHAGLYWLVDRHGTPVADRKHHYAQAFGIYGLSEFYRATGDPRSLELAQELFRLMEEHAYDPVDRGYFEASTRDWRSLINAPLSDKELDCPKSMNTMLHMMEAYTNLLSVWNDECVREQLKGLVRTFADRILDPRTGHLSLFFDEHWHPLSESMSFGHDIEGSWLLHEAAKASGNSELQDEARRLALVLADAVIRDGLDADGSLFSEATPQGVIDCGKDWWPQTEAIVGFYNAYQLTGDERFADEAIRCWRYVEDVFVDRTHGDWFKRLSPDGKPDPTRYKAGPWECPYHHSRTCLEMLVRLDEPSGRN